MTPATLVLETVAEILEAAGISSTRDASGFSPSPIGVLIGLPTRVGGTLGGATFTVPVLVVSGDPVNTSETVDRLYAEADAIAAALGTDSYLPTTWGGSARVAPLPAIEIPATLSVQYETEETP